MQKSSIYCIRVYCSLFGIHPFIKKIFKAEWNACVYGQSGAGYEWGTSHSSAFILTQNVYDEVTQNTCTKFLWHAKVY